MVEIDSRSKRKEKKAFSLTTVTITEVYTSPTHSLLNKKN